MRGNSTGIQLTKEFQNRAPYIKKPLEWIVTATQNRIIIFRFAEYSVLCLEN